MIQITKERLKEIIETAHIQGQYESGLDANYEAALEYYESIVSELPIPVVSGAKPPVCPKCGKEMSESKYFSWLCWNADCE